MKKVHIQYVLADGPMAYHKILYSAVAEEARVMTLAAASLSIPNACSMTDMRPRGCSYRGTCRYSEPSIISNFQFTRTIEN